MHFAPGGLAIQELKRSQAIGAKQFHGGLFRGKRFKAGQQSQNPKDQRHDTYDQRSSSLAGTRKPRVKLNHLFCFERFADCQRLEDDSETKNSDNRISESFVGFLAGNGCLFDNGRRPASECHCFACTAVFLTLNIDETIRTKRLSATRASVYGCNFRVVLALHKLW